MQSLCGKKGKVIMQPMIPGLERFQTRRTSGLFFFFSGCTALGLAPAPVHLRSALCPCFRLAGSGPLCCNRPSVPPPLWGECPRGRLSRGVAQGHPFPSAEPQAGVYSPPCIRALRAAPRAALPFAEIGRRSELLICAILPRGGGVCEVGPLGKEG